MLHKNFILNRIPIYRAAEKAKLQANYMETHDIVPHLSKK